MTVFNVGWIIVGVTEEVGTDEAVMEDLGTEEPVPEALDDVLAVEEGVTVG